MFGSEILEVVIGLTFIYLTLSLLTTAVTEIVAKMFALRSSTLLDGIKNLLGEQSSGDMPHSISKRFYAHPLVKNLAKEKSGNQIGKILRKIIKGKGKPSYIEPHTFALTLYDVLFPSRDDNGKKITVSIEDAILNLPYDIRKPLIMMLDDAGDDTDKFKKNLETWFNDSMERINGWYRRKAKIIAFTIGLVVAILANADSIAITNGLIRDSALRDAIIENAATLVADSDDDTQASKTGNEDTGIIAQSDIQTVTALQGKLLDTQLLGWNWDSTEKTDMRARPTDTYGWILKGMGILLTAAAVSLGAPFWFDILSKVMTVRSSGYVSKDKQPSVSDNQSTELAITLKQDKQSSGSNDTPV